MWLSLKKFSEEYFRLTTQYLNQNVALLCVCGGGGGGGDYLPFSFIYRLARVDGPQREIKRLIWYVQLFCIGN